MVVLGGPGSVPVIEAAMATQLLGLANMLSIHDQMIFVGDDMDAKSVNT